MKKWKPKNFDVYFIPDIFFVHEDLMYLQHIWHSYPYEKILYEKKLVCKTSTEAIALAKAMLKVAERRLK
jgi:hypothetical protein